MARVNVVIFDPFLSSDYPLKQQGDDHCAGHFCH